MQINVAGQSPTISSYREPNDADAAAVEEAAVEAFEENLQDMRLRIEAELKRRGNLVTRPLKTLGEWWQDLDDDADVREQVELWSMESLMPAMHYGWSSRNLAESVPEDARAVADEQGIDLERFMRGFEEMLELVRSELNGETYTATGEPEGEEATDAEVLRAVGLMYFGLSIDEEA